MNFNTLLSIAAIAAVTQVTGCAMVQTTANLETPVVANPASGPAVKIVSVTDNRKFVYPHEAGDCVTPSVDSEKSLNDVDLKARAYARQGRCDGGEWANHAMEVVPAGHTVASKVKEAVAMGFRKAGYRVSENDPSAIAVSIVVNQFWTAGGMDGWGVKYVNTYTVELSTVTGIPRKFTRSETDKFIFGRANLLDRYSEKGLAQLTDDTATSLKETPL